MLLLDGEIFWYDIENHVDHREQIKREAIGYISGTNDCSFEGIEWFINNYLLELLDDEESICIDYSDFISLRGKRRLL